MENYADRRKFARTKKPYMVSFKPHAKDLEWDVVAVLNFGAGGMLFYYNSDLGKDSLIDIRINFEQGEEPIACIGKILRVESLVENMYLIAVNFTDINEKDREHMNRTISEELGE